ncbi:MAG TPA: hypothetical protein VNW06_11595 [Cytophagaceae bacterium]|jgi:hypothetical protein|nr:hypothetical protein [Cytophagaceae bacterium]
MKKSILTLATTVFITSIMLTNCTSPSQKVENAQEDVVEANKNLEKANEEYLADIDNYKRQTDERVAANDKIIADLKARIEIDKKGVKEEYRKKVADLEQKNREMKIKMDDYKADGKEKWEQFKNEFNHDMDELVKAFKDLTVKNVK